MSDYEKRSHRPLGNLDVQRFDGTSRPSCVFVKPGGPEDAYAVELRLILKGSVPRAITDAKRLSKCEEYTRISRKWLLS
jgi:hypothetical protein